MKKIILILAAFVAVSSAAAQNADAILKKLEKNDAATADPKKGSAPATWIERANLYHQLSGAYTSKLIQGVNIETLSSSIGKPTSTEKIDLAGTPLNKNKFEDFVVYTTPADGTIQFWVAEKGDDLKALNDSYESLVKLKSISEKDFNSKGKDVATKVADQFSQLGRTMYSLGIQNRAAEYFKGSAKTSELMGKIDTVMVYYTGIAYTEAGDWDNAITALEKVLSYGTDQDGMVPIYLSTCYENKSNIDKAVKILEDGFEKNPNNANVLSALINVYIKNDIDPKKLILIVQKAESLDPQNASLYLVEGTVWDKLNEPDKAEEAFAKSISIDDKNFNAFFNLGYARAKRGDALNEKANKLDLNDTKGYNKLVEEAGEVYLKSIEALEKAHALNKTEPITIEILRQLYFQKRDKGDEYNAKYEYFDKLHKANKGE